MRQIYKLFITLSIMFTCASSFQVNEPIECSLDPSLQPISLQELMGCNSTLCYVPCNSTYNTDLSNLSETYQVLDSGGKHLIINQTNLGMNQSVPIQLHVIVQQLSNETGLQMPRFQMFNSIFRFQVIHIEASLSIELDQNSVLDANGTGNTTGLGWGITATSQNGGSFGGQGGGCDLQPPDKTFGNYSYEYDIQNQTSFIGSGGGFTNDTTKYVENYDTRGGGAIILQTINFLILGQVSASGFPQNQSKFDTKDIVIGGSGGYVLFKQLQGDAITNQFGNGNIDAVGGNGYNQNGYAGSGGRIIFDLDHSFDQLVINKGVAYGGINSIVQQSQSYCLNGATGTIYFKKINKISIQGQQNSNSKSSLRTPVHCTSPINPPSIIGDGMIIIAPIETSKNVAVLFINELVLSNQATLGKATTINDVNSTQFLYATNINLTNNANINPCPQGATNFIFQVSGNFSINNSNIYLQYVNNTIMRLQTMLMDSSSSLQTGQFLNITANKDLHINSIQQNVQSPNIGETIGFIYTKNNFYQISGGKIKIDHLTIFADKNMQLNDGNINIATKDFVLCRKKDSVFTFIDPKLQNYKEGENLTQEQLLENVKKYNNLDHTPSIAEAANLMRNDFSLVLIAMGKLITTSNQSIISPRIGIFSNIMNHNGLIDASALGCGSDQGVGKGKPGTVKCGGGGASHANSGGISSPINSFNNHKQQCENIDQVARTYGEIRYSTISQGSGGGSFSGTSNGGGNGGGIVYLQAVNFNCQGSIKSNGGSAKDDTDGGGGSGGTILISMYYNKIYGNSSFSVQGGSAGLNSSSAPNELDFKYKGGGAGSGGRIKFIRFNWYDIIYYQNQTTEIIDFKVEGGQSKQQDGRNGSIWTTPCPPGYQNGLNCNKCPKGYYSSDLYQKECRQCQNMPQEAKGEYQETKVPQISPECPYTCSLGITSKAQNPKCLSNYYLFVETIGGMIIFILVIMTIVLLIIVMFINQIICSKKKSVERMIDQIEKVLSQNGEQGNSINIGQDVIGLKMMRSSSLMQLQLYDNNLQFFERDICQHFCRIYLIGNNHFQGPWRVPTNPPAALRQKIMNEKYVLFANSINQEMRWGKYEKFWMNLLFILCPATNVMYLEWRKKAYCSKFIKLLSQNIVKNSFWKNEEDRMRSRIQIKFSYSNRIQSGYIDFLDSRLTSDSFEGPVFPLTLFLSGSGITYDPYHLDYENDPIVKSVGMKINNQKLWKKFVQNLNSKLWCLQIYTFNQEFKRNLFEVLNYLDIVNKRIFGNSQFQISLWIVEVSFVYNSNYQYGWRDSVTSLESENYLIQTEVKEDYYKLDLSYLKKKPFQFNSFLKYFKKTSMFNQKMNEFKFALVLVNTINVSRSLDSTRKSSSLHRHQQIRNNQDSPNRFSDINKDSIERNQSIISDEQQEIKGLKALMMHELEEDADQVIESSPKQRNYSQIGPQVVDADIQFLTMAIREPHIQKEWLRKFKNMEPLRDWSDKRKEYWQNFLIYLRIYIKFVAFRNKQYSNYYYWVQLTFYVILVVFDIVFTIQIIVPKEQDPPFEYFNGKIVFIFFSPLISIISPLLGAAALMSCRTSLYQTHAQFNAVSLFLNTMCQFIFILILNNEIFSIINSLSLIVTKVLLARLLPIIISYQINPKYGQNVIYMQNHFNNDLGEKSFLATSGGSQKKKIKVVQPKSDLSKSKNEKNNKSEKDDQQNLSYDGFNYLGTDPQTNPASPVGNKRYPNKNPVYSASSFDMNNSEMNETYLGDNLRNDEEDPDFNYDKSFVSQSK